MSCAVDVAAPALEDDALSLALGLPALQTQMCVDSARHLIVVFPVVVLRPGIEVPIGQRDISCAVRQKDRPGVTRPGPVGADVEQAYLLEINAHILAHRAAALLV